MEQKHLMGLNMDVGQAVDCQPHLWLRVAACGLWHHAVSVDSTNTTGSSSPFVGGWKWEWKKTPGSRQELGTFTPQPKYDDRSMALDATRKTERCVEQHNQFSNAKPANPVVTYMHAQKATSGRIWISPKHRFHRKGSPASNQRPNQSLHFAETGTPRIDVMHAQKATSGRIWISPKHRFHRKGSPASNQRPNQSLRSAETGTPRIAVGELPWVPENRERSPSLLQHVRKRLRSKSPDPRLSPPGTLNGSPGLLQHVRTRLRSKSPDPRLSPPGTLNDKCRGEPQLRPVRRRLRSKSPSSSLPLEPATTLNDQRRSEAQRTPPGRAGQRAKWPVSYKSEQDSVAVGLLTTPEWRELCRKRGLSGQGCRKQLAQQLRS